MMTPVEHLLETKWAEQPVKRLYKKLSRKQARERDAYVRRTSSLDPPFPREKRPEVKHIERAKKHMAKARATKETPVEVKGLLGREKKRKEAEEKKTKKVSAHVQAARVHMRAARHAADVPGAKKPARLKPGARRRARAWKARRRERAKGASSGLSIVGAGKKGALSPAGGGRPGQLSLASESIRERMGHVIEALA